MWKAIVKSLARGAVKAAVEEAVSEILTENKVTKNLKPSERELVAQAIQALQDRIVAKL